MDNDHRIALPWDGMPENAFGRWRKLYATNPAYRQAWDEGRGPGQQVEGASKKKPRTPPHGPGTELTKIFHPIKIFVRKGCGCEKRAAEMDHRGCDWCDSHLSVIVGWLQKEAEESKVPFNRPLVVLLVKWAISRARRKERKAASVV